VWFPLCPFGDEGVGGGIIIIIYPRVKYNNVLTTTITISEMAS